MASSDAMVIVGTGLAGTHAAVALRDKGYDGRVVLIGEEAEQPYDRVTLSKHFLYGEPGFHGLYFHDDEFYADRGIELQLGTPVEAIDPDRGDVVLSSGKRFRYDALLLATGLEPNRWHGRGGDLAGVHYVRSLAQARSLREALGEAADRGGSVAVVGTGWIGCEVAAAAWEFGLPVSLIGRGPLPLAAQAGPWVGEFFRRAHQRRGVEVYAGAEVAAIGGAGHAEDVVLSDGNLVPADVVIFGIGGTPRTGLAEAAGLEVDNGIVTDEYLATSAPGIYAAGDVANARNMFVGRRSRPEHFSAALAQGQAAAASMLGMREPYRQVPFSFSDQFDIWMECTGDLAGYLADHRGSDGDLVIRELPGEEQLIAFWLRDGVLTAGMNINIKGVPDQIEALITSGRALDPARLANADIPLDVESLALQG